MNNQIYPPQDTIQYVQNPLPKSTGKIKVHNLQTNNDPNYAVYYDKDGYKIDRYNHLVMGKIPNGGKSRKRRNKRSKKSRSNKKRKTFRKKRVCRK